MLNQNVSNQNSRVISNVDYYPREINSSISAYIEGVLDDLEKLDIQIERKNASSKLHDSLSSKLPNDYFKKGKEALIQDLIEITKRFFQISNSKQARLLFGRVDSDMCRLFHVDNVGYRFLCTYRGKGTEWLDDSNVARCGLGKGHNSRIVKNFSLINRASEFDLLILKGIKLFGEGGGAVHRSPPFGPMSKVRVLLRIDDFQNE